MTERIERTPKEKKKRHRNQLIEAAFIGLTLLFLLILLAFSWVLTDVRHLSNKTAKLTKATAHLSIENSKRISDIQHSRVYSCKQTYDGVEKVVLYFSPKNKRDDHQKVVIKKLHEAIVDLKMGCETQTKPKKHG